MSGSGITADVERENRFDPQLLALAMANTRQSVVKHLLTEADRIAVGRICPLDEQGGYAVAMNYGGSDTSIDTFSVLSMPQGPSRRVSSSSR
jgi:hypothetical protein